MILFDPRPARYDLRRGPTLDKAQTHRSGLTADDVQSLIEQARADGRQVSGSGDLIHIAPDTWFVQDRTPAPDSK